MEKVRASLDVFDYSGNKLCGLYDSQNDIVGQAYDVEFSVNMKDGINELSFKIPYIVAMPFKDTNEWKDVVRSIWNEVRQDDWGAIMTYFDRDLNFRWMYLKSEYLIRLYYNGKTKWYIAKKPVKSKSGKEIIGTVNCKGLEVSLKTKNIYMEFDDSNGIGTADELLDKILAGTGWSRGQTDPIMEEDGVTEKVRSITSGDKQGALGLIVKLCNLFKCYPIFDSDNKKVLLKSFNNRDQILEGTVGQNLDSLSVSYNSDDIITRLYCEGEYGDNGYVGIDSANPTGLNYIMNFDYYREIGVMTDAQETALATYTVDIAAKKAQISANVTQTNEVSNQINSLIGQCKMVLYYVSTGWQTPEYVYGDLTDIQKHLNVGDDVVVLNSNGTFRYATIETTPGALIQTGDYGIAKYVTAAAGSIGSKEVAIEAKEKEIDELERKIAATTKPDKIAEYEAEIANLRSEIQIIYNGDSSTTGLYAQMDNLMKSNGYIHSLKTLQAQYAVLSQEQDEIEATFIVAMGDMLRDGYWPSQNYIPGQEQHFYNDAVERLKVMSRPSVSYEFNYIRLAEEFNIPIEDIQLNALLRINDEELDVHDNMFIIKITIGVDDITKGTIEVSNQDITITTNDLGSILSRMSQLADLIEQKNTVYERAKAISKNGSFFTDRLNGQINVLTNQLLSTVSNWYTDEQGNIMFLSADGGSAMMLSGAGFMIANSKDDDRNWIWRTFGTGEGFTADLIVAGFISADRIESGSISVNKVEPNFGSSLIISGNPSVTNLNNQFAPAFSASTAYEEGDFVMYGGQLYVFTQDHPAGAWNPSHVSNTSVGAQIEILPDEIIQYIGQKGYTHTYIQTTDPTLDPEKTIAKGDYWIYPNDRIWNDHKTQTWGTLKTKQWADLMLSQTFYWDGTKWVPTPDTKNMSEAYTRISQSMLAIEQEVYRANAAEGELLSNITQTADGIRQDVSRSYIAKNADYSTVDDIISEAESLADDAAETAKNASIAKTSQYQTAEAIVSTAVAQAGNNADNTYIAKTTQYQTADAIVSKAETLASTAETNAKNASIAKTETYQSAQAIVNTAEAYADGVASTAETNAKNASIAKTQTYQSAQAIVDSAETYTDGKLTSYSTTAQTSSMIAQYVGDNAYGKVSGITITANGIDISGSQYVKIASGGYLSVTTGNFGINTNATDYVMWSGASTAANSNFWVKKDGTVKMASGNVGGWYIGSNYIGNANTLNGSTVGMAFKATSATATDIVFWAGGAYNGSPTFKVTKGGVLTATGASISGTLTAGADSVIGGWTLGANNMHSGSGTTYVALDSGTANQDYAIWAGAASPTGSSPAPFRVKRDGSVYLKKVVIANESGQETTVDMTSSTSSYPMWKLNYQTVKSWGTNSITLSNNTTINFNTAASVTLTGTWSGSGETGFTFDVTNSGNDRHTGTTITRTIGEWTNHKQTIGIYATNKPDSRLFYWDVDATGEYNSGYDTGYAAGYGGGFTDGYNAGWLAGYNTAASKVGVTGSISFNNGSFTFPTATTTVGTESTGSWSIQADVSNVQQGYFRGEALVDGVVRAGRIRQFSQ